MSLSTMDEALQKAFPLVQMPRFGALVASEQSGTRYVVGSNGVFREVTLPWIRLVHPVATFGVASDHAVRLPYGRVEPRLELSFESVPASMFAAIRQAAHAAYPNEVAGVLIWNEAIGLWRHEVRRAVSASSGHVDYEEVRLNDGEHLVVDWHSHGAHDAYFSGTDDRDDMGAMRFSLVIGRVKGEMNMAMRLCMAGVYYNASLREDGSVEVAL